MSRISQGLDYSRVVSLTLSEVLSDIGVSEKMVLKRRRMILLRETMKNNTNSVLEKTSTTYYFGSQIEGSTTFGLRSDCDTLFSRNTYNVIQDWDEWQLGKESLLMIQDETTSPGYCLLQKLRNDEPLPFPIFSLEHIQNSDLTINRGILLLKNTVFKANLLPWEVMNGPAKSIQGNPGIVDLDYVDAYQCKSWPREARPWLERQGTGEWPTEEVKRYCETTGCLFVPVCSKSGLYEDLEWRISTSQAERCLMFNLNITQLRCYVLMKMIIKTFIKPQGGDVVSSFMCKTVLFHCIHNTHSNNWRQSNILACLICCLVVLENFIRQENCPHFIIPENNLMAGRISPHYKHNVLAVLQNIIQSDGRVLLEIPIDDLGTRLQMKMNMNESFQYYRTPAQVNGLISAQMLFAITGAISTCHKNLLREVMNDENNVVQERLSDLMYTLSRTYKEMDRNRLEISSYKLLTPLLSSSLGSVIASHDLYASHNISQKALAWFSVGLTSDMASSRLKLASALYCGGEMKRAEFVLRNTEGKYDLNNVEAACRCYDYGLDYVRPGFENKCNTGNEDLIKNITAFCVRFLRCEINCIPKELQYELFRSTQEDMIERDEMFDCWMDMAVVDSLPYLYFLQYKTYRALQVVEDQQRALANLARTIETESNLYHRETALNLLGQCMEHENRHNGALRCYKISLEIRARNNAANCHICRLHCSLRNM